MLCSSLPAVLFVRPVSAHPFSLSGMRAWVHEDRVSTALDLDGTTLVHLFAGRLDRNRDGAVAFDEIRAEEAFLRSYILSNVPVSNDGTPCKATDPVAISAGTNGRLEATLELRCSLPWGRLTIQNSVFMQDEGGHRHHAEIRVRGAVRKHVFDSPTSVLTIDARGADLVLDPGGDAWFPATSSRPHEPTPRVAGAKQRLSPLEFGVEGVRHVLLGFDHVLFLVAVLLVIRSVRELLLVVTSFTIAHSFTLALGSLDLVVVAQRFTESLIALTIVYVAVENIFRRAPKDRYALTFAFGLVHGFGFSGALKGLGLPAEDALISLFSFNAGVEVGQLVLALPLFPAAAWLGRNERSELVVRRALSGGIAAMGLFWFIERAFALTL